jgi:hypothetical protein
MILKYDKNGDNSFCENEIEEFLVLVKAFAGRRGKPLDEYAVRQAFKKSMTRTTGSLVNITASMMEDEEVKEGNKEDPVVSISEPKPIQETPVQETPVQETPVVDDGFVKLQKMPRVVEAGLMVPNTASMNSEGPIIQRRIAEPKRVEETPADDVFVQLPRIFALVMDTGLVVPNTASLQSEAPSHRMIRPDIKSPEDMLLDDLLSSNSNDFDAASVRAERRDPEGILGYILQSFSGPLEFARNPEPQKEIMMTSMSTNV